MKYIFNVVVGVMLVMFGLYLWFNLDATIQFISAYVGLFFIIFAIAGCAVLKYLNVAHPPFGQLALTLLIGLVFLFLPLISYTFLTWLFILVFLLFAILNVFHIARHKKKRGMFKYGVQIICAIIFIIYAIVMLVNPVLGGQTLTKIIAFFIIINGVAYFFPTNYLLNTKE